jgi:hypothetical protein
MLDIESADRFLSSLFDAIEDFTRGEPSDDMTAAVLKVRSDAAPAPGAP